MRPSKKIIPPPKCYWIDCLDCYAISGIHSKSCDYLSIYYTSGTLKNFYYVHWYWGLGWNKIVWTCWPWKRFKTQKLWYYKYLDSLSIALGDHEHHQHIQDLTVEE